MQTCPQYDFNYIFQMRFYFKDHNDDVKMFIVVSDLESVVILFSSFNVPIYSSFSTMSIRERSFLKLPSSGLSLTGNPACSPFCCPRSGSEEPQPVPSFLHILTKT